MEHSGSKEGCQFALRWVFQGFSFPGTTFNLKMFFENFWPCLSTCYIDNLTCFKVVRFICWVSPGTGLPLVAPSQCAVLLLLASSGSGSNQPASHASQSLPLPLAPCLTGGKLFVQKPHNTSSAKHIRLCFYLP